jgi:hypothetical protein
LYIRDVFRYPALRFGSSNRRPTHCNERGTGANKRCDVVDVNSCDKSLNDTNRDCRDQRDPRRADRSQLRPTVASEAEPAQLESVDVELLAVAALTVQTTGKQSIQAHRQEHFHIYRAKQSDKHDQTIALPTSSGYHLRWSASGCTLCNSLKRCFDSTAVVHLTTGASSIMQSIQS